MLQETPCYERHTQALFLFCDRKHDEISKQASREVATEQPNKV